jgi:Glycosyltransferase 61
MFFPIQAAPYLRLARRLFSGPGSLDSIAYRREIVCSEETAVIPPSVFLPGQLERVIDERREPWFTWQPCSEHIAEATSTVITYAPTIAYHIKDAILFDGSIYVRNFKYPLRSAADKSVFRLTAAKLEHVENGALASTFLGTRFFHHWLTDDCPKYLLAAKGVRQICAGRSAYAHQQQYGAYFGQDWTPLDRARIDELTIFQDWDQNSHKRIRYEALRNRIRAQVFDRNSGSGVYLRRGDTGVARPIRNENEILDSLVKSGFVVVDVSSDNLDYIIASLLSAKIVISMEGSNIAHCVYSLPKGSALLVLQPPDRFRGVHRTWSACLGIKFGFVVGSGSQAAGYSFSVAEIHRTIDLLSNQMQGSSKRS